MALYRQGKAAMDANGIVTGTGTNWQSALTLIRPGATILFLSSPIQMAVVNKVVSDTQINAITTNGAVVASSDYAILLSDSLTVDGLAQDVAETLRYYQSQETVIADAVEFFKDFDFESLQSLANQVKADSEAASESAAAAAVSESKAKTSETNAKASENAAKTSEVAAETVRDQVQQIINNAGDLSTLVTLAQPDGFKNIGQIPSFSALRATVPQSAGQMVKLAAYTSGGTTGGGEFVSVSGSATDDGGTICVPTGSTSLYWKRVFNGNRVHIDWFGADPTGTNYSSDAIRRALAASPFITMQGKYKYGGDPIDMGNFDIEGNGSTITFDAGTQWFICTGTVRRPWATDLYLINGKGYFDFSKATANSYNDIRGFLDINMNGYTGTAIRLPEIDCPWWVVKRCVFAGLTNNGTIGLWDNGSDNNIVAENKFYKNQYHISTKLGSGTYSISKNDFGQFFTTGGDIPRANIWVRVPLTTPTFTGITGMFIVEGNKFGNENERSQDVKLLLANEAVDGNSAKLGYPSYTTYSGALPAMHFDFRLNYFTGYGDYPAHWMRSVGGWMPQTFTMDADNLQLPQLSKGKYFCYVDNVTRTLPYAVYVRRKAHRDSQILWRGEVSNDPLIKFSLIDPSFSIAAGDPYAHSPYPAGIGNGTIDITQQKLPNVTYAGSGMSIMASTDLLGGKEAIQGNYATRYNNIFQLLGAVSSYQPGYIQGELKIADDATFDTAVYTLYYSASTANTTVYYQFPMQLRKGVWTSYCFPVMFMANVASHCLILAPDTQDTTSYPNKVIWSRSRAYLGKTPGLVGVQKLGSLILSEVPTSSTDLPSGSVWRDASDGNTLKIVP